MKSTIFLIISIIIFISGCASSKKQPEYKREYTQPLIYNADCFINNEIYSESNVLLLSESVDLYKVKAGDGIILGLPIRSCILSQVPKEKEFDSTTSNQKWVKCSLGSMNLVTDSLIYIDDEKYFYRLKRKDGQIWLLPREHCAIYNYDSKNVNP